MKIFQAGLPSDNPNPNASIGFLCWSPFHYYVYKNIYRYLPEAEFIIGERRYLNDELEYKNLKNLASFLNEKGVLWRFFDHALTKRSNRNFFNQYKAVVSASSLSRFIQKGFLNDILKIRVLYGNAKDLYNFGIWSADFELILTYGPYSQKFLEIYTLAKIVGNPKFDDWFNGELDGAFLNQVKTKLNPAKKTVLYLPTHDSQKGMSSLSILQKADQAILNEYNFILKLHYLTRLEEPRLVEELENAGYIIFDERHDILPLLKTADLILSDNSGAIFDAILADKPIVLFETPKEIFERKLFLTPRGVTGLTTYLHSIEQKIKTPGHEVGPVIAALEDLQSAIKNLGNEKQFYYSNLKKIRDQVFQYQDGQCGKRAANEIKNLIKNFSSISQNYPFIYHARKRESEIARGYQEKLKTLPFFKKISLLFENFM